MVETELPRLSEGISFSSDSDVPVLSSGSRRKRMRKRKKEAYRSPRRRPNTDEDDSVVPEFYARLNIWKILYIAAATLRERALHAL